MSRYIFNNLIQLLIAITLVSLAFYKYTEFLEAVKITMAFCESKLLPLICLNTLTIRSTLLFL